MVLSPGRVNHVTMFPLPVSQALTEVSLPKPVQAKRLFPSEANETPQTGSDCPFSS